MPIYRQCACQLGYAWCKPPRCHDIDLAFCHVDSALQFISSTYRIDKKVGIDSNYLGIFLYCYQYLIFHLLTRKFRYHGFPGAMHAIFNITVLMDRIWLGHISFLTTGKIYMFFCYSHYFSLMFNVY